MQPTINLTAIVRRWFHDPYTGMGYRAEKHRWGTYWSHGQVYAADVQPADVPAFLADVRACYRDENAPGQDVHINLDSRDADVALGSVLLAAGCTRTATQVFLAHDGAPRACPAVPGLTVEPATAANIDALARTKMRAFDADDAVPPAPGLAYEIAQRRLELSGSARGLLARLDGEPAGFVWWYAEADADWIVLLGVRAPFRRRGLARWLLCRRLIEARRQHRPVLINVLTDNARALRLYRSLGFVHEVYWRYRYVLSLS